MGRKAAPQPLSLASPSDGSRAAVGETAGALHSARLSPDTASPRSPRSPFRYGPQTRPQAPGAGEPSLQPLADVLHQPQPSQQHSGDPQQQQRRPDETRDLPQPSPRGHSADQHQQLGHRHLRRGEDKASKSGFFFNFGKTAKSADRPIVHQHSNSRAEAMSRDSDRPTLSKQSTTQSGTLRKH
jgi:hypothetical protein